VQVVKDPIGTKGARLTTNISIASRYLVFMPRLGNTGVSQKIEGDEERKRLREILQRYVDEHEGAGGYIARTAAEAVDDDALCRDMAFLAKLWRGIKERCEAGSEHRPGPRRPAAGPARAARSGDAGGGAGAHRLPRHRREGQALRGQVHPRDRRAHRVLRRRAPAVRPVRRRGRDPKALERKVQLKSGGHLVIDQTEAMTTIDVNTGAFVGHRNLEETIFKTNLEAAQAICRQLRLRNLGGIIIIDFIDMTDDEHKRQVLRALEKCLAKDHAKTHITEVSALGLVEMTRKRTRESLEHVLCEPCPAAAGAAR
jgi:ribonuclease G